MAQIPALQPPKLLRTVELLMHRFQVRVGDVGVDLSRSDVAVAEHGLDGAQVGAVHQ